MSGFLVSGFLVAFWCLAFWLPKIEAKEQKATRAWCAEHGIPYQPRHKLKDEPEGQKPPRHIGLSVDDLGYVKVRGNDARVWKRRLERYQPMAHTVYEGPVKHVALLHLLGLDDSKLTYFHAGRFKQLSQNGGQVINELIAA